MAEADGLIARAEQRLTFATNVCAAFVPALGDHCGRCAYSPDVHLIRDLTATVQQLQQEKEDAEYAIGQWRASYDTWQVKLSAADTHREALTTAAEVLKQIVAAYDVYRGRGVQPAPDDYQRMAILIDKTARNTLAKLAADTGRT